MTLKEKQSQFIELFNLLESWQERFQYLIEIGSGLPEMPERLKNRSTLIQQCTSRTYFGVSVVEGRIFIQGWSNASIPSGMIMLLINIFQGISVDELWKAKIEGSIDFHIKTNLINNLTEPRKASLLEMINRILFI